MGSRVTVSHIAADAGVSRSTVSLVLRQSPLVADATREKVNASIERLGYIYHRGAAGLRRQQSGIVGLVVTDIANPIFAELMLGIEEVLGPAGYTVILANTFDDPQRQQRLTMSLLEHRVDGIMIVPALGSDATLLTMLHRADIAHVTMMRSIQDSHPPYIGSDDAQGGGLAATHLLEHGCRDIVYAGGPDSSGAGRHVRLDGFSGTLRAAGHSVDLGRMPESEVSGRGGQAIARRLLAGSSMPDGIVCHSDVIAFGLLRGLRDAGVDIPGCCRVVGFDDVEQAQFVEPPLTSVSVAPRDVGEYAAIMVMRRITNPASRLADVILQPSLRVRASCGC